MTDNKDHEAARTWLGFIGVTDPELVDAAANFHANARADDLAKIEQLTAAGNAAFYAMCAFRENSDKEVFQDAIDALGAALESNGGVNEAT